MSETLFGKGAKVTVLTREIEGHCRTPRYSKGIPGVVTAFHGRFRNPESLAYHGDGLPLVELYQVRMRQRDLWPDYGGSESDCLLIDLYEQWLTPGSDQS